MYTYRKLSPVDRAETLAHRRLLGLPLHEPPHFPEGEQTYLLTAATYEHRPLLAAPERRVRFLEALWTQLARLPDVAVFAWVVLPNHYHLLLRGDLGTLGELLARLHNRSATAWNAEDGTRGRRVWFRFADRRIRNQAHFQAAVNYLHVNPVRHGLAENAADWTPSSLPLWLETYGREQMVALWHDFPVLDMGRGWDDI